MSTRCDWFLDDLVTTPVEASTPRINADSIAHNQDVTEVGKAFDLRDPKALTALFVELIQQEQRLSNRGITCELKHFDDVTCSVCTVRHEDPADSLTALCTVGVQQEKTATEMRIAKCRPR